jgi:hypothetical protein
MWPPCTLQAELTRKRLERAGKLTSGLADEGVRWQHTVGVMDGQIERLVGDVFLGAACISYYGAFTGAYRCAGGCMCTRCLAACGHPSQSHQQLPTAAHCCLLLHAPCLHVKQPLNSSSAAER